MHARMEIVRKAASVAHSNSFKRCASKSALKDVIMVAGITNKERMVDTCRVPSLVMTFDRIRIKPKSMIVNMVNSC